MAFGIVSGLFGLGLATSALADPGATAAPPQAPAPPAQAAAAPAQEPSTDAVHPSDVLAELTGLGPGQSRAIARMVRFQENAIPVIKDAKLEPPTAEGRVVLLAYQISANEACVRNRAPEGRAALRAAREACRTVRGVESKVLAIRCAPLPRGGDGCASTTTLWRVEVGWGPDRGRPRYGEDVTEMRLVERDVDGDPAAEVLVDFVRDSSYVDLADVRSGGDVFRSAHELIVIDADGAVLARQELRSQDYDSLTLEGTTALARVRGEEIRFAVADCDDATRCPPEWGSPHPLAREPVARPEAPVAAIE